MLFVTKEVLVLSAGGYNTGTTQRHGGGGGGVNTQAWGGGGVNTQAWWGWCSKTTLHVCLYLMYIFSPVSLA